MILILHRNKYVYAEKEKGRDIPHVGTHANLSISSIFFKSLMLTWSNAFLVIKEKQTNMLIWSTTFFDR